MRSENVIEVGHVWKRYGLPMPEAYWQWRERRAARRPAPDEGRVTVGASTMWALRDIDFAMARGETLGLIGRNGAGKSTLLKVLARVSPPTRGSVRVTGRVFSMIELNAGLHTDLTGRENVRLLGAIMGLARREIEARLPAIEAFCELGDWFDKPAWQYSSGMLARIGFAVAVNIDADVLLVDEVLAVGDLAFQQKCYERFEALRGLGTTTVFVSHNLRQVERICDRVLYLERGQIVAQGKPQEVCLLYSRQSQRATVTAATGISERATWESSGELEIDRIEVRGREGVTSVFEPFDAMCVRVHYTAKAPLVRPIIGCFVLTYDLVRLSGFSIGDTYAEPLRLEGSGWFEMRFPRLPYLPGAYTMDVGVRERNGRTVFTGRNMLEFTVNPSEGARKSFGVVHTDVEWSFDCGLNLR